MTDLVLNKNFYNYVGCILFCGYSSGRGAAQIGQACTSGQGYFSGLSYPCSVIDTSGVNLEGMFFMQPQDSTPSASWNHSLFVFNMSESITIRTIRFICGSGTTTAATVNDYALDTPNTDITATIDSGKRDTENSIIFTVTFSASTEQSLTEIGLVRDLYVGSSPSFHTVMLGRCKLDNPITLNENNNYSVTLQIRLSLPIPV